MLCVCVCVCVCVFVLFSKFVYSLNVFICQFEVNLYLSNVLKFKYPHIRLSYQYFLCLLKYLRKNHKVAQQNLSYS